MERVPRVARPEAEERDRDQAQNNATTMLRVRLAAGLGAIAVALLTPYATSTAAGATVDHRPQPRSHGYGYVALGDSYSSGEGTGVYDPATDTSTDRCHRSPLGYPTLLAQDGWRLRPLSFVACSGAVTTDLYTANHSFPGEPAQLTALSPRTGTVTLTLGGNDVGFVEVASACIGVAGGGFGCSTSPELNAGVQARRAALAGRGTVPGQTIVPIARVLADIARRAPRARIYLAGYPALFGRHTADFQADAKAPSKFSCQLNATVDARIDYRDAQWVNDGTAALNQVLRTAVGQARRTGVRATYVAPRTFAGHGLCDRRTAWINPILISGTGLRSESLHPTPTGQRLGYAVAFRRSGLC